MNTKHGIAKERQRKTPKHTVFTVICECGTDFQSIISVGSARGYHTAHRKMKAGTLKNPFE